MTSTTGIANSGTLNLAGGDLASAISGVGTTNITADVTSSKVVEQDIFTTTSGKKYTNNSTLTVNNTLTNAGIITNNSSFIINGATGNSGTIDGANGVLRLNNNFENAGTISQHTLVLASGKTLTNDALKEITVTNTLTNGNEIINKGTLNVSGTNTLGLISDASTATGILNLTGTITADKAVTQKEVNI